MLASDLAMSVSHSGHLYAMALAASSLSPAAHLSEQFGGLSQVLVAHMNACARKHVRIKCCQVKLDVAVTSFCFVSFGMVPS